jgi:preprotein translocase subunit SecA
MNSQREVIYKRRKNALFGERLQLDILNMLYDTCDDIILNTKGSEDYDSLRLNCISILGLDFKLTKEEFDDMSSENLTDKLYLDSLANYKEKNRLISERATSIFKDIYKNKGATIVDVLVPITDGKKQIGVSTNLQKNVDTNCRELILSVEKIATLAIIDQLWKEHLREMDDLKQSVQNAVYEQKDPLLIYKFEAFELFKRFVAKVNEDTISFLTKADLPVRDPDEVQEVRNRREARKNYRESKEESRSLLQGGNPEGRNRPPVEKSMPRKSIDLPGRNDRVTVQYEDGTVKKEVKFKTVEQDVVSNKCVIIEN